MLRRPPKSTPFPDTTLFRSILSVRRADSERRLAADGNRLQGLIRVYRRRAREGERGKTDSTRTQRHRTSSKEKFGSSRSVGVRSRRFKLSGEIKGQPSSQRARLQFGRVDRG